MRRYELSSINPSQYEGLTPEEKEAWLHPEQGSYHSFHVERMGNGTYRWRDSRSANFYVGGLGDLTVALCDMKLRKVDPDYQNRTTIITLLSQSEIDDLLGDL